MGLSNLNYLEGFISQKFEDHYGSRNQEDEPIKSSNREFNSQKKFPFWLMFNPFNKISIVRH